MLGARVVEAIAYTAELGEKGWLIIQTAQVEDERSIIDMANDRLRQIPEGVGECCKAPTGALALDWSDNERRARQGFQR